MPYRPVRNAARLGAQTTAAEYQRRKIVPCDASRSRFGVDHSLRPQNPTSPYPRSSARINTMFGGRSAPRTAGANRTRAKQIRAKRRRDAKNRRREETNRL